MVRLHSGYRVSRPSLRGLFAVFAAALLATGCQGTLTIEEAKRVTASFEGASFEPPPRTIRDITAILDDQAPADPEARARRIAAADEEPPDSQFAVAMATFYARRAKAARSIGRMEQRLSDLRTALSYDEKSKVRQPSIRRALAGAEAAAGNYLNAIEQLTRYLDIKPDDLGAYKTLVFLNVRVGNLEGAQRAKRVFLAASGRMQNQNPWQAIHEARIEWTLLTAEGRFAEAEPFHRREIEIFLDSGQADRYPHWLNNVSQELARNLRRQGRLMEAEVLARDALVRALRRLGKFSLAGVFLTRELGAVLYAQGRYEEAEALVRASIDIAGEIGVSPGNISLMLARRVLGEILVAREDWPGALRQFERIREEATSPFMVERLTTMRVGLPLALLRSGRVEESRAFLKAAHRKDKERLGPKHYRTAEKGGVLAMAHAAAGDDVQALAEFAEALPVLLSRSRQSDDEDSSAEARDHRLNLILESYMEVLARVRGGALEGKLGIDPVAEAFRVADVARTRSVQRALAASGARAAARNPDLADLARREQDAQQRISALFDALAQVLGLPTDQRDSAAVDGLRTRIDALRQARATLMEEIEARFPDYADLINPKPATVEAARSNLRPGEALIATYVGAKKTYLWAIPREGEMAFAAADLGRDELADRVALLRSALEPKAQTLGDIPDFDVARAHGLYRKLLEPVAAGWKDAESLLVVAHGPLGYLPLSLLPTEAANLGPGMEPLFSNYRRVPWLARSHAVTMLPSVASLGTLRGLPPGPATRQAFVGFGDPVFSQEQAKDTAETAALSGQDVQIRGLPVRLRAAPRTSDLDSAGLAQLPRLPDTADEVRSIAVALEADLTRDLFLGARANEKAAKSNDLSRYKVIAFATHGLVPGDLDGLMQPALALTAPGVAGVEGDGLLTMGEILGLKLDADWVVLSACNTGSGAGAGAEAVSGLGRAFFYAGTRALLVSNWPVETTSAKALTTDLFRRQAADAGLSRAEALRRAMLALIDEEGAKDRKSGKVVFSYAHPIFWAPFSLIGDGGGAGPRS